MDAKDQHEILPAQLTVYEFMREARCCESTARRWIKSGKVQTARIGRRLLIPRAALVALLAPKERVNVAL